MPPTGFFTEKSIAIDEVLISEHVLQLSFDGKELTSLTGKSYKFEGDKKIVLVEEGQDTKRKKQQPKV